MATRMQKIKVSVFLLSCMAIMAAGFITVAELYKKVGHRYWIEFDESVLGVNEGGIVEYLGVPVGKVDRIEVNDNNTARVEVVIDPQKVRLKEGVQARLVIYSLAAGTMAIELSGGDPGGKSLPNGSNIPVKASVMASISTQSANLVESLTSIAEAFEQGLEGLEKGKLSELVNHADELLCKGQDVADKGGRLLDETTATVTDLRGRLKTVSEQFTKLSEQVGTLAEDLTGLAGDVRGKVGQLDVAQTQQQLSRTLENIAELSGRVNEAVAQLGAATDSTLHEADNIQHSLDRTLRDVSVALESVSSLANQLKADPASVVRGKGKMQSAPQPGKE